MKKRLSILFFGQTPPPYHGVSVMNMILFNSHFMRAFDVTVIETDYAKTISELGSFSFQKVFKLIQHITQTTSILLKKDIDIVCYPINFTKVALLRDFLLLLPVKIFRKKIIFYTHGNNLPGFRNESSEIFRKIIDWTIGFADAAIVVGENLRFNYNGFLPPNKIIAVHHGIEAFSTSPTVKQSKEKIQVLYLSNLVITKGFLTIIHAIPKVVSRFKNITFAFAGEWDKGVDKEGIMTFIKDSNIQSYIDFKGRVIGKEKELLLCESDIFVFPTFYPLETFGIVNLEAMQAGLPIVTTGRGAIPEVVDDGINGFIVPEKDSDAIAEKIIELCKNQELRAEMCMNNIAKFHSTYTKEKYADRMVAAFETLYKEITEKK